MNARMLELAVQSGLKKDPAGDREYIGDFDWRTFGNLIVRECADIALKSGSVTNKSEAAVAEADRIYHKINEYFGVGEVNEL